MKKILAYISFYWYGSVDRITGNRSICYNPSGNNFCCHIPCSKDADYTIVYPPDGIRAIYDRYSHVCKQHVGDLWDEGCELHPPDWEPDICNISIRLEEEY